MADSLPNKEVPNFDLYPGTGTSGSEDLSAASVSRTYMPGTSRSTGAVPSYNDSPAGRSALEQRAAQVGGAVGRAVGTVRRGTGKLLVMKSRVQQSASSENLAQKVDGWKQSARGLASSAQERASDLAVEARERASEVVEGAQERLSNLAGDLRERAADVKNFAAQKATQLRSGVNEARRKAESFVTEDPLRALAVVGGTAVVLGAALRIVRSRNAQRI